MENFINNAPFIVVLLCLIVGFVFLVKGADLFVELSLIHISEPTRH